MELKHKFCAMVAHHITFESTAYYYVFGKEQESESQHSHMNLNLRIGILWCFEYLE